MANNNEAIKKIAILIADLQTNDIDFLEFITEFEVICYNDISSRNLDYFADGWSRATVSSFMKVCLMAFVDGDVNAIRRLNADLGLECKI